MWYNSIVHTWPGINAVTEKLEDVISEITCIFGTSIQNPFRNTYHLGYTGEPLYNEDLKTMTITLYQVSHSIRVQKQRNIKSWDQQNHLVIRGFCYIRPLSNKVPLYCTAIFWQGNNSQKAVSLLMRKTCLSYISPWYNILSQCKYFINGGSSDFNLFTIM